VHDDFTSQKGGKNTTGAAGRGWSGRSGSLMQREPARQLPLVPLFVDSITVAIP
jgi:hypothetical protein